jgi:hypothetical protein
MVGASDAHADDRAAAANYVQRGHLVRQVDRAD